MDTTKTINIITLGCSKNIVDSEHLAQQLQSAGYKIAFDSDNTSAKIVIINTCGFIGDAKEESVEMILNAAQAKQEGRLEKVIVVGCLSQRYADELRVEIPEVDQFYGVNDWAEVAEILGAEHDPKLESKRVLTTPKHYAYLKISEGCDWKCGYCAIPLIRGPHVSVPFEQIVAEAEGLVENGVNEIMVIGQDTTYYGVDLYGKRRLAELLERLCEIPKLQWIRLHYTYPTGFPQDVIDVMAREPKICKYIDIPLQHIADNQLTLMKRRHDKAFIIDLIARLRSAMPDIAIRTTMLVGYPGESENDFAELMEFVKHTKFDRLGVFAYSPEEGTYSAEELTDDVSDDVKQSRCDRIMTLQAQVSLENNLRRVGTTTRIVVDSRNSDYYIARTQYDSPEVDQEILIPLHKRRLLRGHFYNVRISQAEEYDLYGEVIS